MVHINEIVRGMCCTKRRAAFKSIIPAGRRVELGRFWPMFGPLLYAVQVP